MVHRGSLRFGGIALLVTLALTGCGRKGPLELPPGAPQTQSPAAVDRQQAQVIPPESDAGLIQPPNQTVQRPVSEKLDQATKKPSPPINGTKPTPPDKSFLLDPLL